MSLRCAAVLVAALTVFAACGGGGRSKQQAAATHQVSGVVSAAAATVVDWDVADPNAPRQSNNDTAHAQLVPSAVTVGGIVSSVGTATVPFDPIDVYKVALAAGQRIVLTVADPAGVQLGLCVVDVTGAWQSCSPSTVGTATLQIDIPSSGTYYVEVTASSGASSYTLVIGAGPAAAAAPAADLRTDREFVPGELVVRFKREAAPGIASARTLAERAEALGLRALAGAPGRAALLGLGTAAERARALAALGVAPAPAGTFAAPLDAIKAEKLDTLRAVGALRARADVETADPNYVRHPSFVPNDNYYGRQWNLPLLHLPQAWDLGPSTAKPGAGVVVAVVDTGVFLAHPDLQGQLTAGYDFVSDPTMANDNDPVTPGPHGSIDPNPDDPGDNATPGSSTFHGTHVAGIVAATTNNALGVAGVAFGGKVMPVRALGVGGGTSYDILQAVRYAAGLPNDSGTLPAPRADVINLSFASPGYSTTEQLEYAEVRRLGVILVAAAGNDGSSTPSYPASYPGVVSVAAVDGNEVQAPYSSFGPTIAVAAPGGSAATGTAGMVLSTWVDASSGTRTPVYGWMEGTSMASPHVAGVAALMKAACSTLTPDQFDYLLASGQLTVDLGAPGRDDIYGYGLIDAVKAVQAVLGYCGKPVPPVLQVTPSRLDFVPGQTSATLTAAKLGGDTPVLSVTSVAPDAASSSWITVTGPTPASATGLGAYTVTVSPDLLADGVYRASITFAVQNGSSPTVVVPVTLQKGASATSDLGFLYVVLLDKDMKAMAQWQGKSTTGTYGFSFAGVADGTYFVAAGTDLDNDGMICDAGEACGAWPTLGVPSPVVVSGKDVTGLDFVVGFGQSIGGSAPARLGPGTPLPAMKTFLGVGR